MPGPGGSASGGCLVQRAVCSRGVPGPEGSAPGGRMPDSGGVPGLEGSTPGGGVYPSMH